MQNNINEAILEEIDKDSNISLSRKKFLRWLLNFELDNSNKEQIQYKREIQYKAEETIKNA